MLSGGAVCLGRRLLKAEEEITKLKAEIDGLKHSLEKAEAVIRKEGLSY